MAWICLGLITSFVPSEHLISKCDKLKLVLFGMV